MAQIRVLQPFTLNLGATMLRFAPGTAEVSEEVADHWYTKLFVERIAAAPAVEPEIEPASSQSETPAQEPEAPSNGEGEPQEPAPEPDGGDPETLPAPADTDDKAALKAEAEALGIGVDGRWGIDRIKAAISEAKGS